MDFAWLQGFLKRIDAWHHPPKVIKLRALSPTAIAVNYRSGLDVKIQFWGDDGLYLTVGAYLPSQVEVLMLRRGICTITNAHYSQIEGKYVTIPMDRELARQYVAVVRKYLRKHCLHDSQWNCVLLRMYVAMETIAWGA